MAVSAGGRRGGRPVVPSYFCSRGFSQVNLARNVTQVSSLGSAWLAALGEFTESCRGVSGASTVLPPKKKKKVIPNVPVALLMTRLVFCLRLELVRRVGWICAAFPQFCRSETSPDSDELKRWRKGEMNSLHTMETLASAVKLQWAGGEKTEVYMEAGMCTNSYLEPISHCMVLP